ncbi:MAG: pyrroline-5-carboxylate reductase [Suipraeoptans sp.]
MKIGFIGTGNMSSAILSGILSKGEVKPEDICGSAKSLLSRNKASEKFGIKMTDDNKEVALHSDIIFLGIKPQFFEEVILEIKDVSDNKIIVSMAPGRTHKWLEECFGKAAKVVRIMPNTPAFVGEGMTAVSPNDKINDEELAKILKLLSNFGKCDVIPEKLMETAATLSGSSPAYVYMFIEAMADAAVLGGIPRDKAYKFAAQAVLGSAKMVLETGQHPGELKDNVCSPGGSTIAAVRVLEERGFRSAIIEAMIESEKVAKKL